MRRTKITSLSRSGFTLLELIIVIAIITVLAGVAIPTYQNAMKDSKLAKVRTLVDSLKKACLKFRADTDSLPQNFSQFINGTGITHWKEPYLESPITTASNPWNSGISLGTVLAGGDDDGVGGRNGFLIAGKNYASTDPGSQLLLNNVPVSMAILIDESIDGAPANPATGRCEYTNDAGATDPCELVIFLMEN